MNRERWLEMAESFLGVASTPASGETLCSRCREFLSVSGAAISLMTATNPAVLCAVGEMAALLEDAQFTLGEGPSQEAFVTGRPVAEDQFAAAAPTRWPALARLARDAEIEGIFAFPLQIGAARSGVLTLYQMAPGSWSQAQQADALIAADVLTHVVLAVQANAPAGVLAEALRDAGSYRAEVHQASGMLSAQAGFTVAEALVRLRSLAYLRDRPIADLALAVIARRLRLGRNGGLEVDWIED